MGQPTYEALEAENRRLKAEREQHTRETDAERREAERRRLEDLRLEHDERATP